MSRLLKRLSPFAPDGSGACGVFYELGGITVICDAGGCAGNVCGFDEPRWYEKKSALFSAGLRDMDAILGRDDMLVKKLVQCCEQLPAAFTAIVGTPVPAVIATDYKALAKMAERKTNLPCFALDTNGANYYDSGAEKAYYSVFTRFAEKNCTPVPGRLGILGATPLDTGLTTATLIQKAPELTQYHEVVCFGLDSGLEAIRDAGTCSATLVMAPCALKTARYLQAEFGIPYQVGYPCLPEHVCAEATNLRGKKVLIIHQQMAANALRDCLTDCDTTCATWFMQDKASMGDGDFRLETEAQLMEAVSGYDVVIADAAFRRAVPDFAGQWIDFPHYAVSGRLQGETL